MNALSRATAILVLFMAFAPAGCAAESDESSDELADSVDAALSATRIQMLGPISPGETKTLSYTASPKYRAFTFSANAGDKVKLHATAANGSAVRLWILGSSLQTLASNSTRTGGDLSHTLKNAGTYTFAIATIDATRSILTLSAGLESAVDAPPVASCVGDITPVEAQAAYSARRWLTLSYHAFTRSCEERPTKSCTPWANDDSLPVQGTDITAESSAVRTFDAYLGASGEAVSIATNVPLVGPLYSPVVTAEGSSTVTIDLATSITDSSGWCQWDHHTYCGYPYTVTTRYAKMSGVVTESCARLSSGVVRSNETDAGGVIAYVETTSYWTGD